MTQVTGCAMRIGSWGQAAVAAAGLVRRPRSQRRRRARRRSCPRTAAGAPSSRPTLACWTAMRRARGGDGSAQHVKQTVWHARPTWLQRLRQPQVSYDGIPVAACHRQAGSSSGRFLTAAARRRLRSHHTQPAPLPPSAPAIDKAKYNVVCGSQSDQPVESLELEIIVVVSFFVSCCYDRQLCWPCASPAACLHSEHWRCCPMFLSRCACEPCKADCCTLARQSAVTHFTCLPRQRLQSPIAHRFGLSRLLDDSRHHVVRAPRLRLAVLHLQGCCAQCEPHLLTGDSLTSQLAITACLTRTWQACISSLVCSWSGKLSVGDHSAPPTHKFSEARHQAAGFDHQGCRTRCTCHSDKLAMRRSGCVLRLTLLALAAVCAAAEEASKVNPVVIAAG